MPGEFQRQDAIARRIASVTEECLAAYRELDTLNDEVQRTRKKRQIQDLESELMELEARFKAHRTAGVQRQRDWEDNLHSIDYQKARELAEQVHRDIQNRIGAVSFFIQNSKEMEGRWCVALLKRLFDLKSPKFVHHRVDFASNKRLDEGKLILELKNRLGITSNMERIEDEINVIANAFCRDLRNGSVLFIELEFWETAAQRRDLIQWILSDFWSRIVSRLDSIGESLDLVNFVLVIVANKTLFYEGVPAELCCQVDSIDPRKLVELPLDRWTPKEIELWLKRYANLNLPKQEIELMAREICGEGLTPSTVYRSLMDELDRLCG
jgi:hypothetical protein